MEAMETDVRSRLTVKAFTIPGIILGKRASRLARSGLLGESGRVWLVCRAQVT